MFYANSARKAFGKRVVYEQYVLGIFLDFTLDFLVDS